MSRSVNKVILLGNVGNAPEVRSVGSGARVAQFSLATSKVWNDAQGTKQEKTEWHRCVAWNTGKGSGLADVLEKYVGKGDKLYVEGEIEYRQWQDKDGQTRNTTEIRVRDITLLGGNRTSEGGAPAPQRAAKPVAKPTPAQDDFSDFPGALEDEDDDLPF